MSAQLTLAMREPGQVAARGSFVPSRSPAGAEWRTVALTDAGRTWLLQGHIRQDSGDFRSVACEAVGA